MPEGLCFAEEEEYDDGGAAEELALGGSLPSSPCSPNTSRPKKAPTNVNEAENLGGSPSIGADPNSTTRRASEYDTCAAEALALEMEIPDCSDDSDDEDEISYRRHPSRPLKIDESWTWLSQIEEIDGLPEVSPVSVEIVPGVLMGGVADAMDVLALRQHGITHIVNCAKSGYDLLANSEEGGPPDRGDIAVFEIDALDDESFDWTPYLGQALDFIDSALAMKGVVLVHCLMGLNRSGIVIAAYLMVRQRLGLLEAISLVRAKRGRHVLMNSNFQKQLIRLADAEGLLKGRFQPRARELPVKNANS